MALSRSLSFHARRISRSARSVAVGLVALLSTTGCFTYRPVTVADLQPEMTVHMQLTAVAVDRLRNAPNGERRLLDGFALDGMVTSAGEDSVIVSVPTSNASDPSMRAMQFRQPLTIRRGEVEQIQLRTLDRKKTTWVAVTLSVLGVAAAAYAIRRGGEATGSTPVPGGPNESRGAAVFLRISH